MEVVLSAYARKGSLRSRCPIVLSVIVRSDVTITQVVIVIFAMFAIAILNPVFAAKSAAHSAEMFSPSRDRAVLSEGMQYD